MSLKIIRDPVHDYIVIDEKRDGWVLQLLDTPEVQRLRHIRQLGVSDLVYPGATHTRLAHSLGVYQLMLQATDHLQRAGYMDEQRRKVLLAAALLHDVGHGPFSHILETLVGSDHEEWTCNVIQNEDGDIAPILREQGLLENVVSLISKSQDHWPAWEYWLVSSQVDLDRMDFLLRDSHFTGARYGAFDSFRLIHTMQIEKASSRQEGQQEPQEFFTWPDKCKYAIEQYLLARYHMYHAVYFHKTTRGYEKLLEAIWERAADLAAQGDLQLNADALSPFLYDDGPSVRDYLRLSEYHILSQVEQWMGATDSVLADLCSRFMNRVGFKAIEIETHRDFRFSITEDRRRADAKEHLRRKGDPYSVAPDCYLRRDTGTIEAYKPYKWEEKESDEGPSQPVLLTGMREITHEGALPRLRPLTKKDSIIRYYCPEDCIEEVSRMLRGNSG